MRKHTVKILITCLFVVTFAVGTPNTTRYYWALNQLTDELIIHGPTKIGNGISYSSIVMEGRTVIELRDTSALNSNDSEFTVSAWFNPYNLKAGQQMIIGKNRYSLGERQWSLTIENDGRLRAHLQQGGWKTISCEVALQEGHWHEATLSVSKEKAALYLNGSAVGNISLSQPIPATDASIAVGGIRDGNQNRQEFIGALDEIHYELRAISSEEIASRYRPINATHVIPETPKRFALWNENFELKKAHELPKIDNVEFRVIKKWDKANDGYTFLHGVALAWHEGKLYASIGHNKGAENTVTEEAQYRVSDDGGKNWGPLQVIDAGEEPENLAVSHGVFLSHEGKLWAFHGAYYDKMKHIHTRAYSLDEATGQWKKHGKVVSDGFWALNQPVKMDNGNWIMAGGSFGQYSNDGIFPAAVAISQGNNFNHWTMVSIPVDEKIHRLWGESSLFVDGSTVYNIARYGGGAQALVAMSKDYGQTWTATEISNLPMATSKPAAGILSNGQRYLICTTAADNGGKRTPLTIAVSRPGENIFSKVFAIRRSLNTDHPGESADNLSLSYPCATEYEGNLYIGYSNNGGRKGNLNSAELAIVPVAELFVEK